MIRKRILPCVLAGVLTLGFSGCAEKPKPAPVSVPEATVTSMQEPETIGFGAPSYNTAEDFTFEEEAAERLGGINSDIYGRLYFYYQDSHILIFNSDEDLLFTLDSNGYYPNYEETPVELHGDDVNFDGHTDFYLLYSRGKLNDYCFFWLWNMRERTFEYYVPLSSIPSPVVDAGNQAIVSTTQLNADQLLRTVYRWQNGNITAVSNEKVSAHPPQEEDDDILPGMKPEIADTRILVQDGHVISTVVFNVNENTHSRWICTIENPNVVALYSDELNAQNLTHTFMFRGVSQGVTTVVFRYSTGWDDTYVTQKVLNIQVGSDRTVYIVEVN